MLGLVPYFGRNIDTSLDRVFNDMFGLNELAAAGTKTMSVAIRVNVEETDEAYLVDATVPGVSKENVDINFKDDVLTISVSEKHASENEDKNFVHREIAYASQSRSMRFDNVDASNISAKLEDGILHVIVPKVESEDTSVKVTID